MKRDWYILFLAIVLMFLFALDDKKIDVVEGAALIMVYAGYIFLLFKQEKVFKKVVDGADGNHKLILFFDLALVFVGVIGVIYSANLVIDNGVFIANVFSINEELIISLQSISKGLHGLSIGNLIGGGITDPLLSLGAGAVIAPVFFTDMELSFDMPFLFVSTLVAWLFFMRGGRLDKAEASILIGMYVAFIYLKFFVVG